MARRRTLGAPRCGRHRGAGGDLRRLLRRPVVAVGCGPDQSRHGDAVAGRGHRGKYRQRQHRRSRRHADRTGRADSHRRSYPRHRGSRPRPRHRGERAQGRGAAVRHFAVDGPAARRKPQPGRCRALDPHHAGRHCHGLDRRYQQTARNRRHLEARGGRRCRSWWRACSRSACCERACAALGARADYAVRVFCPRRPAECLPGSTGWTA